MSADLKARAEAAEKEVERLRVALADLLAAIEMIEGSGGRKTYRLKISLPRAYAHALSALPPPVPTEEGGELKPCPFCASRDIDPEGWASTDRAGPACQDCGASADTVEIWNTRPTQAPQDVAGLVEALTAITAKLTAGPFDVHSAYMIRALRGDLAVPLFEARSVYGDPALEAPGLPDLDGGWVYRKNTTTARTAAAERQAHVNVHALADLLNALPAILSAFQSRQEGKQP